VVGSRDTALVKSYQPVGKRDEVGLIVLSLLVLCEVTALPYAFVVIAFFNKSMTVRSYCAIKFSQ